MASQGAQWSRIHLLSRRCRFDPWVGKISWNRKWQPTPVIMPGKSHGQRSLVGYGPWGLKESDLTEQLNKKKNMLMITAEVTKHLLCARREATGFANLNHSSNSWTSKETAAFHRLHSRVDMPLMKPQIRSQRAHDPKKNHQACCGARVSWGTLILPTCRPGAGPLIFQLTDDKSRGPLLWVSVSLRMEVCRRAEPPCSLSELMSVKLWVSKAPSHFRLICLFFWS